ncbi:hypothetical protein I3760_15G113300 [Carya illinoinensis]|nr:hypothetical protein I3760_15G113300 [Carya illinoinensis]
MTRGHHQKPPPEPSNSRVANRTKRKHSHADAEESHCSDKNSNRTKKRRSGIVAGLETQTLIPYSPRILPNCNRFDHLSSSPRKRRKKRVRNSRATEDTYRKWVSSSRDFSNCKDKLVIVSYNILGVNNASNHPDLYCKVPPEFLEWDQRKILIREEINNYKASILCFQEVDRFEDLDDLFQTEGFVGVYKARTGEAYDGCAIFWKDKLFTLLHQENIEFRSFGLRDNVAQLCVLELIQNQSESKYTQASMSPPIQNRRLLVGNIHVLFNPNRGDIKLGQLDVQLHDRRKISGQLEYPFQCRDFRFQNENAARRCAWMPIPKPLLYRWSDEELRLATGTGGVTHVQHQLKLCSAYIGVPGSSTTRDNHGEPLATSYHSKFMGTVDYIWHTEELVPVRVLETLPINSLRRSGGLPSEKWGSDHLALVCELAFADDVKGTK